MTDPRVVNASRFLVKMAEHTWGLPSERDTAHWSNSAFYPLRSSSQNFIDVVNSWVEQRQFVRLTIEALADHPVVPAVLSELSLLTATKPDLTDFVQVSDMRTMFQCPVANIKALQFGADGSVVRLNYNNIEWANDSYSLGSFLYTTYNDTDIQNFVKQYEYWHGAFTGYQKNNLTASAAPESKTWPVVLSALYQKKVAECDFYARIYMADTKSTMYYGAPAVIWLRYTVVPLARTHTEVQVEMQWFSKSITRLPEALSLSFRAVPQTGYNWSMWKMGQLVDPHNVILNGSQYQHVLDDNGAVFWSVVDQSLLAVRSLDVPVACPLLIGQDPRVYPAPIQPITSDVVGVAFNIYNNVWETNYILWYPYLDSDSDFKARFVVDLWMNNV